MQRRLSLEDVDIEAPESEDVLGERLGWRTLPIEVATRRSARAHVSLSAG
jgi:hypothetical protein